MTFQRTLLAPKFPSKGGATFLTPLPPPPPPPPHRKVSLWHIFFPSTATNGCLSTELKFRENTLISRKCLKIIFYNIYLLLTISHDSLHPWGRTSLGTFPLCSKCMSAYKYQPLYCTDKVAPLSCSNKN